jgi:serine/threonine-protein kinase
MAQMGGEVQPASMPETASLVGQVLGGKYRVEYLLGQGGMAAVWAGVNERTGKRVALKVIRNTLSSAPGAESFLHSEGLAASRVNHPNVVSVFDVIEHEGMACIVMELLDGEPLGSFIARRGPLSVNEATSLLVPAMRGVAAAHAMGVIHRDLKPQNIFICIGPDGRVVTTKVLDFGISIMVEQACEHSAGMLPGLVGTPSYMSPEHIKGGKTNDERADIYGFGVLLYEVLTGKPPFPGEPGVDLLQRVLSQPPPPVTSFRPDLPPGLVSIIEKAMAKQPEERFPRLDAMIGAIEDEIMPPTPLPPRVPTPFGGVPASRMPTPMGGVPASTLGSSPSGQLVSPAQGAATGEPAKPHQETMTFSGSPLEAEPAPNPPAATSDTAPDSRLEDVALLPPASAEEAAETSGLLTSPQLPDWATKETILADDEPPILHWAWRGLLVLGILLALGYVVRTAMEVNRRVGTDATVPVVRAATSAPEPVAPPPATSAAASATSAAASATSTVASATSAAGPSAAPGAASSVRSAAKRTSSKSPHLRRQTARPVPNPGKPTPNASSPASRAALRAGQLSPEDF